MFISLEELYTLFDFVEYDIVGIAVKRLPETIRVRLQKHRVHPNLFLFRNVNPKDLRIYNEYLLYLVCRAPFPLNKQVTILSMLFRNHPVRIKLRFPSWMPYRNYTLDTGTTVKWIIRIPSHKMHHVLLLYSSNAPEQVKHALLKYRRKYVLDMLMIQTQPLFTKDADFLAKLLRGI